MPIYEYECMQCGKIEEALQKFSDKPLTKCRHCSGKLHKQVSRSSFQLKGTGWYVTDYAKGGHNASAKPAKEKTDSSSSVEKNEKKSTQESKTKKQKEKIAE